MPPLSYTHPSSPRSPMPHPLHLRAPRGDFFQPAAFLANPPPVSRSTAKPEGKAPPSHHTKAEAGSGGAAVLDIPHCVSASGRVYDHLVTCGWHTLAGTVGTAGWRAGGLAGRPVGWLAGRAGMLAGCPLGPASLEVLDSFHLVTTRRLHLLVLLLRHLPLL